MKKYRRLIIIIGGFVTIILLASYFSFKSYTNIGVNDNSQVASSSNKPAKNNNKKQANNSKKNNDKSIFLQNSDNPDRIIAINPYGSKGVYQYRKQANGDIYPEYKYFNGSAKKSDNSLNVVPTSNSNKQSSMNFTKNGNGIYVDKESGQSYNALTTTTSNQTDKKPRQLDPMYSDMYLDDNGKIWGANSFTELNHKILDKSSDPELNDKSDSSVLRHSPAHYYIPLANGQYFDISSLNIYGGNTKTNNPVKSLQIYHDPDKYAVPNYQEKVKNSMMSYTQNNQTHVSQDEIDENVAWTDSTNDIPNDMVTYLQNGQSHIF